MHTGPEVVNKLISKKTLNNWGKTFGLYIYVLKKLFFSKINLPTNTQFAFFLSNLAKNDNRTKIGNLDQCAKGEANSLIFNSNFAK
jgi:hypothetical protein